MRFKEYLKENVEQPFLTDRYEVEKWLQDYEIENYTIRENGVVDVHDFVHLIRMDLTSIPIKFGRVEKYFDIDSNTSLTSFHGFPDYIGGYFSCQDTGITSLEYAPKEIGGMFNSWSTPIKSLVGVSDNIKRMGWASPTFGRFLMDYRAVTEGGIGLLLIDGLASLLDDGEIIDQLPRPFQIIESYIGKHDLIFECQTRLIDEGFEEFAKL